LPPKTGSKANNKPIAQSWNNSQDQTSGCASENQFQKSSTYHQWRA
jgi:hypothetical protein